MREAETNIKRCEARSSLNIDDRKRYGWLDVLKCVGMFEIFVGHFDASGPWMTFIFMNQVPLFFFVSGCTEFISAEGSFKGYLKKKSITLLLPYYFFCVLLIIIRLISNEIDNSEAMHQLFLAFAHGGVRNTAFGAIWFLSCLWTTSILFKLIHMLIRRTWAIVFVSMGIFLFANTVIHPIVNPSWYYNIDSALYYLMYYSIGYGAFPWLRKTLSLISKDAYTARRCFLLGIVLFGYSALAFFGFDILMVLLELPILRYYVEAIRALFIIAFLLLVSYCLRDCTVLQRLGRSSLYLCGSESIAKIIVTALLSAIGVSLSLFNPLQVFVYAALLMCGIVAILEPVEKMALAAVKHIPSIVVARNKETNFSSISLG
ncbi:acyltransferase [Adlercreutzia sp. R25]|uniref:acyltransferase family protein n=1 Tax=Adlercreutzia shanghongiae TaxID=3111773 RepID=UPI002DB8EE21|nr:acyltransferase [Adlercreutzia sp. R25]MEC4273412.1 acyltransferase [Adlercreutzia sp. R25]